MTLPVRPGSPVPLVALRVNASYAGCYVIEVPPAQNGEWSSRPNFEEGLNVLTLPQNSNYMMEVGSEGMDAAGQKILWEGKVLRCHDRSKGLGLWSPMQIALDAPSPSLRSAVQSPDRLASASPLINQRDCEGLGCCYNPSNRMNPCYYGNTDGWRPGCVPPAHSHRQGCENLESGLCHFGQHLQVTWWRSGSCRELTQIWFCTTDGPLPVPTPSSSCSGRSWWTGACTQETTTAPSWCLWEPPRGCSSPLTTSASLSATSPSWSLPSSGCSQGQYGF
ncbi:uncharacterized protein LOC102936454 [Chelonia mydas]|uniref:uncharacterized protein LOC102936454 n=1 Tax=Chelonia mydas TaxID=8469 RepID=UPI001CA8372A|nr:uncharacterized protein LOC102936454 [Chelonia mydas]